jgi:hypothetical protein
MSGLPAGLDSERHAELRRRVYEPWARRVLLVIFTAGVIAALLGAVGQRAHTSRAEGRAATLELRMPTVVRGGLLFEARIRIGAVRTIHHPRLILDSGFFDGLQVNTIEPAAASETSEDGRIVLSYDEPMRAGSTFTVYMQFQLNPTSVGRTSNGVSLADGSTVIAHVDRSLRRLP